MTRSAARHLRTALFAAAVGAGLTAAQPHAVPADMLTATATMASAKLDGYRAFFLPGLLPPALGLETRTMPAPEAEPEAVAGERAPARDEHAGASLGR